MIVEAPISSSSIGENKENSNTDSGNLNKEENGPNQKTRNDMKSIVAGAATSSKEEIQKDQDGASIQNPMEVSFNSTATNSTTMDAESSSIKGVKSN